MCEAEELYRRAARLRPDDPDILNNLGVAYITGRRWKEAVECLRRAMRFAPGDETLRSNLAYAWAAEGSSRVAAREVAAGIRAYRACLRVQPDFAEAYNNLGVACLRLGRLRAALRALRSATRLAPDLEAAHSSYLYTLNFSPWHTPESISAAHRAWGRRFPPLKRPAPIDLAGGRRLRVGYVAADLREHPTSYFFEPLLSAHDHARFEVFCYANLGRQDRYTERIRGLVEHWREIFGAPDDEVAEQIRRDGIDILVDRIGHCGNNRLALFARRPAPVQAALPGYANTSGLPAIDYRITDGVADPAGMTEKFHTETLVRLNGPFACYRPPDEAPEVAPSPAVNSGRITFGAFHNRAKITRPVAALWARVLRAVRGSTLLLHHFYGSRSDADPEYRDPIVRMFRDCGVGAGRLEFVSGMGLAEHLGMFGRVDIMLDPFPFSGNTITCESLWMGVPVVTLEGRTHVSRVSASLLASVGLDDWIARSPSDYVAIASRWARDREGLARLRLGLRRRMAASRLTDGEAYARDIEAAFCRMWEEQFGR